jgi:hypothetical protein
MFLHLSVLRSVASEFLRKLHYLVRCGAGLVLQGSYCGELDCRSAREDICSEWNIPQYSLLQASNGSCTRTYSSRVQSAGHNENAETDRQRAYMENYIRISGVELAILLPRPWNRLEILYSPNLQAPGEDRNKNAKILPRLLKNHHQNKKKKK